MGSLQKSLIEDGTVKYKRCGVLREYAVSSLGMSISNNGWFPKLNGTSWPSEFRERYLSDGCYLYVCDHIPYHENGHGHKLDTRVIKAYVSRNNILADDEDFFRRNLYFGTEDFCRIGFIFEYIYYVTKVANLV